jgi:hypothetical protein
VRGRCVPARPGAPTAPLPPIFGPAPAAGCRWSANSRYYGTLALPEADSRPLLDRRA